MNQRDENIQYFDFSFSKKSLDFAKVFLFQTKNLDESILSNNWFVAAKLHPVAQNYEFFK